MTIEGRKRQRRAQIKRRRQKLVARWRRVLVARRRRPRFRALISIPTICARCSRKQSTIRTIPRSITRTRTTLKLVSIFWRSIYLFHNRIYYLLEIYSYYRIFIKQFCIFWSIFMFILLIDYCNKADIN